MIAELKQRALAFMRKHGRKDDAAQREGLEAQVKAVVDSLADEIRDEDFEDASLPWIFRQKADREVYTQILCRILDDARALGRQEMEAALAGRIGWECVCACKVHGRVACAKCLNVRGCTVHSEVTAADLRPHVLGDARALEQELFATMTALVDDEGFEEGHQAVEEALRRVVCARWAASKVGDRDAS